MPDPQPGWALIRRIHSEDGTHGAEITVNHGGQVLDFPLANVAGATIAIGDDDSARVRLEVRDVEVTVLP